MAPIWCGNYINFGDDGVKIVKASRDAFRLSYGYAYGATAAVMVELPAHQSPGRVEGAVECSTAAYSAESGGTALHCALNTTR